MKLFITSILVAVLFSACAVRPTPATNYSEELITYEMDSVRGKFSNYIMGSFGGHRFVSDDKTVTAYSKVGVRTMGVRAILFRTRRGKYFMTFN